MELGYKASRKGIVAGEHGDWKYCTEEAMRRIVGDNDTSLKLSIMADAERCDYKTDIPPKSESVVDLIRVATYINQIPTALDMVKDAQDKGYETTLNLMAVSTVQERELNEGLELMAQSGTDAIYVVDSFGSLYSEQVHFFVKKYKHACRGTGVEVGMHAHNNLQLGFANTIEAIVLGCNYIDATMAGTPIHLTAPYVLNIYCEETAVTLGHPACGQVYRLWARSAGKDVLCGQFAADAEQGARTQFVVPVRAYEGRIEHLFVTLEPLTDTPQPTGPRVLESL